MTSTADINNFLHEYFTPCLLNEIYDTIEEMKYSIREELSKSEGDSLYNGQNPMNSVRNKE